MQPPPSASAVSRWIAFFLLPGAVSLASICSAAESSELTFEKDIRPILKTHCFQCHGEGGKKKGGVDLRLRRFMLDELDEGGHPVVPGDPGNSLVLELAKNGKMPKDGKKLAPDEIAKIEKWIATGAKTIRDEPAEPPSFWITEEERAFWSFQPIRRPQAPDVRDRSRVRNPIDAFVLAKLEAQGLGFAPEADKRTLIRRLCFDLTGLPPAPEDVARFLADTSPGAYEKLVDELLASPRYGERWGRHWLDVAGYADSEGYTGDDTVRKFAWKYRDYVIRAFNEDKPFDQFIREQLAGDEMVDPPYADLSPEKIEKLTATGFLRMVPDGTGSGVVDQNAARNQVVADTIKIVSTSLLGLTVGCAQCHDHRYDPLSQEDYYRLRAILEPAYDWKNWRTPQNRLISLATTADRAMAKEIEAEAAKLEKERLAKEGAIIKQIVEMELEKLPEDVREPVRAAHDTPVAKQTPEQKKLLKDHPSVNVTAGSIYMFDKPASEELKKLAEQIAAVRSKRPVEEFVPALTEVPGKIPATFLFNRGDPDQPKQQVAPGVPVLLASLAPAEIPVKQASLPTTGRRLAFARWLASENNPLTARVIANRVWLHLFGRGIVGTPADFGALGDRPTHPELLDWLASELMTNGWRLKPLHRLIVTSTAYRQSAEHNPAQDPIDPENRLLARRSVLRLDAEAIRDSILAVSGKLNPRMFGAPVPVMEDEAGQVVVGIDTRDTAGRPTGKVIPLGDQEFRRSIYVQMRRSKPLAVLNAFDAPTMEPNCEFRKTSTVSSQSLMLMNSGFVLRFANDFADRVRKEAGDDERKQVSLAWQLALGQEASVGEVDAALEFLDAQTAEFEASESKAPPNPGASSNKAAKPPASPAPRDARTRALSAFCHALMSSNEFLYVD
jgi:uncharacterized protein DUF1553/uncharacterized protein DUF1549/cytochrome c